MTPDSGPSRSGASTLATWLAILALPMSLLYGIGGILGLIAVTMASPDLRRHPDDRRTFATVILGFTAVLISGCIGSAMLIGPGSAPRPQLVGTRVTERFEALDGSMVSLADVDQRLILVDVWATWCPPCIAAIPMLESIHRDLADQVRVVSIAAEPARVVGPWIEARRREVAAGTLGRLAVPTYPVITNDAGSPDLAAAVRAYPTMWILAPDGTVLQELVGTHDLPTVLMLIRAATERPLEP